MNIREFVTLHRVYTAHTPDGDPIYNEKGDKTNPTEYTLVYSVTGDDVADTISLFPQLEAVHFKDGTSFTGDDIASRYYQYCEAHGISPEYLGNDTEVNYTAMKQHDAKCRGRFVHAIAFLADYEWPPRKNKQAVRKLISTQMREMEGDASLRLAYQLDGVGMRGIACDAGYAALREIGKQGVRK